jgi:L-alanine-DL-glutamate epimerase-like enolase superfamily enzyme
MLTFTRIDDHTAIGGPAPEGWTPITARPLLVLVGVTGAGKSTTLDALRAAGLDCRLLPDRRLLTDLLMIPQMQLAAGEPVAPVHDRKQRFDLTRAYRERYPGGMGHALAQLMVDNARGDPIRTPNVSEGAELSAPTLLLFDGLRGENEVRYAAQALPLARFVMLDAPDVVRVARLMGRNDPFDQLAGGRPAPDESPHSFIELGAPEAVGLFSRLEEATLLRLAQTPAARDDLRRSLAIVAEERRNYDPAATRAALLDAAPARALVIDTAAQDPAAVAQQILALMGGARGEGRGARGPIRTPNVSEGAQSDPAPTRNSQLAIRNSLARGRGRSFDVSSAERATPTVSRIDTTIFRLPLFGELKWGKQSALAEARHVLVQVTLSDGSQGVAEAPPRPTIYGETAASVVAIIAQELAPRIAGQPAVEAWQRMAAIANNHTAKGAIDMAIHAALAQSAGVTLAHHLGCTQARIPVSFILGIGARDEVLAEAERVVAAGVRVLKVKVGRDWGEDVARIRDLQAMFGAAVRLYADANECLDLDTAAARLDALRDLGLVYCEEPLPVEQILARAALRRGGHLPLIADDSAFTLRDLARELALDTFDILNIKTPRTGYTESLQMLARAQAAGKGVMVGSQAGTGIGVARAALFAALPGIDHPSECSFHLKLRADIIDRPLPLRDGFLALDDVTAAAVDAALLRAATVG